MKHTGSAFKRKDYVLFEFLIFFLFVIQNIDPEDVDHFWP